MRFRTPGVRVTPLTDFLQEKETEANNNRIENKYRNCLFITY
jgi:hypothetical protein